MRKAVQSFVGPMIPWVLDDFNVKTTDDQQINAKIDDAVRRLDKILSLLGLKKGTPEYEEKLAVGLFYFTYFPKPDVTTKEHLTQVSEELETIGLNEFKNFLFLQGGLGDYKLSLNAVAAYSSNTFVHRTGLEALRAQQGLCTENSEILYAVFRRARLNPQFAYIKDLIPELARRNIPVPKEQKDAEHVCIKLSFGGKTRLFDLSIFSSNADWKNYFLFRLPSYLARHKLNKIAKIPDEKIIKRKKMFEEALMFDPNNPNILLQLGVLERADNNPKRAEHYFQEAIKKGSTSWLPYQGLAEIYQNVERNPTKVIGLLKEAIKVKGLNPPEEAGQYYMSLAKLLIDQNRSSEAIDVFKQATRLIPLPREVHFRLGLALIKSGKIDEAKQYFEAEIAQNNPRTRTAAQRILQEMGDQRVRSLEKNKSRGCNFSL